MVMGVFDNALCYGVFHDSDPRTFNKYVLLPFDDVRHQINEHPAHHIVLKPMTDMYRLRMLLDQLVDYDNGEQGVGLWLYRRMEDVVNSHARLWTDMPATIRHIARDPSWENWRSGGLSEESLALLRRYATEDLTNETACALFWLVRNIQFFEQGYDGMADVALVPYERFVIRSQKAFGDLFAFLGLPFSGDMIQSVHGHSVGRHKQPRIDPDVKALCEALEAQFDTYCDQLPYCPPSPDCEP